MTWAFQKAGTEHSVQAQVGPFGRNNHEGEGEDNHEEDSRGAASLLQEDRTQIEDQSATEEVGEVPSFCSHQSPD